MDLREWLPPVVRRLRKGPLVAPGHGTPVSIAGATLERLLPHRPPMLLVDAVEIVDLERHAVRGRRRLRIDDLGFQGHFPGDPIYPGMLLVETMGQLGLTLIHFESAGLPQVPDTASPPLVRATHVHYAAFFEAARPGDDLVLHAQVVEHHYTMVAAGQAFRGDTLLACAVSEVYVDE